MADTLYATNRFPGDGVTTTFEFSFAGGYIAQAHVKAYIQDALGARTTISVTSGMFVGPFTLNIGMTVPVGSTLVIYRDTPKDGPLVDYTDGARLTAANLDLANQQNIFAAAEAHDLLDVNEVLALVSTAVDAAEDAAAAAAAQADISLANAELAADSAAAALGFRDEAEGHAADSLLYAAQSQAYAEASATSAAEADAIADALAGGSVGFDAPAYDFGYVADETTYFNRDFGSIV